MRGDVVRDKRYNTRPKGPKIRRGVTVTPYIEKRVHEIMSEYPQLVGDIDKFIADTAAVYTPGMRLNIFTHFRCTLCTHKSGVCTECSHFTWEWGKRDVCSQGIPLSHIHDMIHAVFDVEWT